MTNDERMLMEVIHENFENMRHAEVERRWFMHIYFLAITGALIAQGNSVIGSPFWVFLLVLSLVGLLLTIRWNANIKADTRHNHEVVCRMPREIQTLVSFGQGKGWISLKTTSVLLYALAFVASVCGFVIEVWV